MTIMSFDKLTQWKLFFFAKIARFNVYLNNVHETFLGELHNSFLDDFGYIIISNIKYTFY